VYQPFPNPPKILSNFQFAPYNFFKGNKMYNREKAIQELCASDYEYILFGLGAELLDSYLEFGFVGYSNMTDEQLIQELKDRDISELFEENLDIELDNHSHIKE
jgi:hypothetical protein